ncbi:hypothetical protein TNCV_1172221 [Trichonephila clavipes]|uniref:Uncharacterized protein n=1 Tax=Trichonephila clavipes TaxID=2585209 RepID=A0A8X6V3G5_TRICX|nr:hypothetical protein TNCV_1172221 [Trichonephila clavipes]
MDICKCIVFSWHGGTPNNRRAASPLMRLVAGDERWEAPDLPPVCSPSKFGWNRAKPYGHLLSRLRPTTGVHLALCHGEYHGPRSRITTVFKLLLSLSTSFRIFQFLELPPV